ncbi:MAG: TRL domain-containing protein [Cytophagales bacterium]
MKKIKFTIAAILASVALASCSVTLPLEVTNNPIGTKVGKISTPTIFSWMAGTGLGVSGYYNRFSSKGWRFNKDYCLYNAAKSAGITKVATVDLKTTNYILFRKYELIVTGE